jgi:lipocalin-like protein
MNRLGTLGLSTVAALGLALPGSALSQQKSLKEKLVGTWSQVPIDVAFSDGTKRPLYGENPKGIVIYTSDGYFSLNTSAR